MVQYFKRQFQIALTKFSFGATSAIITSLGLIMGLRTFSFSRISIISGLFLIAVADNISDSLGIHIYQESECLKTKDVWVSTLTNFLTRFLVVLTFALFVILLPMTIAVIVSIVWGFFLLSILSFSIARREKRNPYVAIVEHIAIAVLVIIISNGLGKWFGSLFK